jgi:hypothetical protein
MQQPMSALALVLTAIVIAIPPLGAEESSFGKDLKATIALQGMPCDQVVDAKRNADSDYVASCKDGNRYHIFVNPQGRVVVQKLTP